MYTLNINCLPRYFLGVLERIYTLPPSNDKQGSLIFKSLILSVLALLSLWLINSFHIFAQPIYYDSFYTIGAGAKLFMEGHSSSTFMLYGLINPFFLEWLLNSGLAESAPFILRLFQQLITFGIITVLGLCLQQFFEAKSFSRTLPLAALALLSSTIMLKESLEPTPEIGLSLTVSLMIYLLIKYKPCLKYNLLLGFVLALFVGFRPVGMILAIPIFLVLPEKHKSSFAGRYWKWVFLSITAIIPLSLGFPEVLSFNPLFLPILLVGTTLVCVIMDIRDGSSRIWLSYLTILLTAVLVVLLFFPHYVKHWSELLRQINDYHISREVPVNDLNIFLSSLGLTIMYLLLVFPGPLAAIGFLSAVCYSIREKYFPHRKLLWTIAIGFLPFLITTCRNLNMQSRYLIPLSPLVFLVAAFGIRKLLTNKIFALLLAIPLIVSAFQLAEAVQYGKKGGMLLALKELSSMPPGLVTVMNLEVCTPEYYDETDPVFYPILPFVSQIYHSASHLNAEYCISYGELPDNFEVYKKFGYRNEERSVEIRNSNNPELTDFKQYLCEPFVWKHWTIALLGVRNTR